MPSGKTFSISAYACIYLFIFNQARYRKDEKPFLLLVFGCFFNVKFKVWEYSLE